MTMCSIHDLLHQLCLQVPDLPVAAILYVYFKWYNINTNAESFPGNTSSD